jgi:ribitol-5-phosphate 2-dehydrogenase (NADP+) / D-ribitol-5-phosphate cytidylyltransferase
MEARFTALLLMAGIGSRLGSPLPKQFHLLGPQKIYLHTLTVFLGAEIFSEIILVCHPDWIEEVQSEIPSNPRIRVISGGSTRQASSFLGLQACDPATEYVMIHDAVRPFVSKEILERNKKAAIKYRAVDTCIPSADTIVYSEDGKKITSIPPRKTYLRGQTPQTFDYQLICEAHRKTRQTTATDDCSLILELQQDVAIVAGEENNMKITTELDIELAKKLYEQQRIE